MSRLISSVLAAAVLATGGGAALASEYTERTANSGNVVMQDVPEIPADIGEQLRQYQNVRSASLLDWSEDGESIFISTRFAEVSQIHRVDAPGGARHQLSWFDEPVGGAVRRPGSNTMAFLKDQGGNEFSQIFLFEPSDGSYRMISDGESRNGGLEWSQDGRFLAFQSTRRNGRSNDLWIMDIEAGTEPEMVLESPDGSWWGPSEFSADGTTLLVQQYVSVNDSRIHLLDLESGELTRIAGSETAPSRNLAGGFSADGDGIHLLTDRGSEFARLAFMPLSDTSELEFLSASVNWSVSGAEKSPDGTSAAVITNEGGISRLYRLDMESGELSAVEGIPVGLVSGLSFSPDGEHLGLVLNSPQSPSDVYALDWDSGELTRWTFSEVGGLDSEQFVVPDLIEYPTFDQVDGEPRTIPAFVYRPQSEGPHPVVIQIHGGPESQSRPGFSSTYPMWMDRLGVAVIRPNVRGSSGYGKSFLRLDNGFKREDSVRDIGALLDWIETQPDLDSDRVAVFGGSYGGYMVLASAVHYSDRLKAAVDVVGISNFVTFLENTQDYRRDLRRVEYGDERDPEMRAHLEAISPLNNVDQIDVPMFVIQGQNDPRVPVTEAEQVVEALREQGSPVWYMNALNEGHGFRRKENRDLYSEAVVLFFETYLLGD